MVSSFGIICSCHGVGLIVLVNVISDDGSFVTSLFLFFGGEGAR